MQLVKSLVGDRINIKASGGIRSIETLIQMYEAGAKRFGVNLKSGIQIVEQARLVNSGLLMSRQSAGL